jgi:hypothetical protein
VASPLTRRHQSKSAWYHLRLAASHEDPGQTIALDFIGLSYESAILAGGSHPTESRKRIPFTTKVRRGGTGAAPWGLELMFQAAAARAGGVNFHGGVHNRRASEE